MTTQFTIIGMGQIGTSVGMALKKNKRSTLRVGHDIESGNANKAKKMGAVDKVSLNLISAVEKADIVLLALPVDQVRETLELTAGHLKAGAIVLDTSPVRKTSTKWGEELLPEGRHYIGFTPLLGPGFCHQVEGGVDSAHADLFERGVIAITASSDVFSGAMNLASELAELLGATPLFADIEEVDSHMAALHVMPQLVAGALARTTVNKPGWQDGRKFAGRVYAQASSLIANMDTPGSLACAAVLNKENTLRALDGIIGQLQAMRSEIEGDNLAVVEKYLEIAREGRKKWWAEREAANWSREHAPDLDGELTGPSLFGRLVPERKKRREG